MKVGNTRPSFDLDHVTIPRDRLSQFKVVALGVLAEDADTHQASRSKDKIDENLEVLPMQFLDCLCQVFCEGCPLPSNRNGEVTASTVECSSEKIGASNATDSSPETLYLCDLAG